MQKTLIDAEFVREKIFLALSFFVCFTDRNKKTFNFDFFSSARFSEEISKDSQQYCSGVEETRRALAMGVVETLLVRENFDVVRRF